MGEYKGTFKCVIMTPDALLYQKEVQSIFLTGDRGEYELLAYHYPLIGIIQKSDIILDWKKHIPVRSGILRFFANECTILIEEAEGTFAAAKKN